MRKWKGILLLLVPAVALCLVDRRRPRTTPDQPAPPNGYQVLDAGKLGQRSAEVFPTAYMTVLSIAQGVALGVLVSAGSGAFRDAPIDGRLPLTLEILSTLASILVVYYMYVWFVLVFRWAPGVLDSLIPLTLGGVEILLAISVGNHRQWLVSLIVLMFAGGLAFLRSIWRSTNELFSDTRAHATVMRLLWRLTGLCFAGGVIYTVGFVRINSIGTVHLVFLTSAITLVMLIVMLASSERGLNRLYEIYGLSRWPRRRSRERSHDDGGA